MHPDWHRIESALVIGVFSTIAFVLISRWILSKLTADSTEHLKEESKENE